MRADLERLIYDLKMRAWSNEHIAKHGSPVTSMGEDAEFGEIAREQRRIVKKLEEILRGAYL